MKYDINEYFTASIECESDDDALKIGNLINDIIEEHCLDEILYEGRGHSVVITSEAPEQIQLLLKLIKRVL